MVDLEVQVGAWPGTEDDQDAAALPGPCSELMAHVLAAGGRGSGYDQVDRMQQRGDYPCPLCSWMGDQGEPLERDAGLGGGDNAQLRDAGGGHPQVSLGNAGGEGKREPQGSAHGDDGAAVQPAVLQDEVGAASWC